MRSHMLVAALALGVMGSGCLSSRVMGAVTLSKEKNVTLIQTQDVYSFALLFPVRLVHQFWKCSEVPGEITCKKVCSTKSSDLTCPAVNPGGFSNVSTEN